MNSKIVIVMFFSFSIPLTTLYLMDEWVDAASDENIQHLGIDSEKDDPNELRIIILGSSRVTMLDSVFIDNYVLEKGHDVDVYNGGSPGSPTGIKPTVDDWISKNPEIVFLAVEMYHHFLKQNKEDKIQKVESNCSAKIPTLPQMIENLIPVERKFM